MRVESFNQIAQIYGLQKNTGTRKTRENGQSLDQLSISRAGHDYQIAKNAVSEASDIREGKVAELKARVDAGTYQVSPEDFASKLLEKYNNALM